ncbi:DUF4131 domain-containing protein, partial [Candidatus Dependentiae bacterium]|nr:DUF4131 domain-containing protein [Candidatus Dependentiae bacterium]
MKISNKIPLFFPLIFLLLGIIYQEFIPSNFYLLAICIILNIFLLLKNKSKLLAYSLIFLSGAFLLQNQKNKNLEILNQIANKKLNLIATVTNKENLTSNNIKEEITLKVSQIKKLNKKTNTNFNLLCYTYTPTKIIPGQKVEIKNVEIKKISNTKFKDYLIKEGIISSFFSKKLIYKIINKN